MSHSRQQPTVRDRGQRARRNRDRAARQYSTTFEQYMSGTASQRDVAAASAQFNNASLSLVLTTAR
jgi:hypothetical protein